MKLMSCTFAFLALFSTTESRAQTGASIPARDGGCTFAVAMEPKSVAVGPHISFADQLMRQALATSDTSCRDAGWSDCRHDGTYPGTEDYNGNQVTYSFQVPVSSAECAVFVADRTNAGKWEIRNHHYVRTEKARRSVVRRRQEQCRSGGAIEENEGSSVASANAGGEGSAPKTGDCRWEEPAQEERGKSREIPDPMDPTRKDRRN